MTPSFARRALLAACFIAAVSVSACRRSNVSSVGCQSDDDCKTDLNGSDRAFCDQSKAPFVCALHPKQCDTAADCCPAQVCNAQGHYCFDKYTPCTDGFCPAQGEVCNQIGIFVDGFGCTFNKCDPAGACGQGTNCFNRYCVGEPPCNGGCKNAASPVCVTATNLCSPAPKDPSCAQTCPAGKVLVLQDPTNIFDTCNLSAERCECDSLPPLQIRDVARHSSLAASGQNLYVSAYDGEHGDLVVHTFDKSTAPPALQKTEWLDGVPSTGHVGGDVNGPRHGITDPGPNVGQYTSIVASPAGDLYVAYYDVDNGDLKFIARYGGPAAQWTAPVTVDGSTPTGSAPTNGDVGMYASIALDSNGIPAIAYFRRGSYDAVARAETGPSTALLYAVAKRAQPLSKADWVVVGAGNAFDVDAALRPPPQAAEVLGELPTGVGLMPSLAFIDNHPVIAYYENLKNADGSPLRAVKAVMGSGSGAAPSFGTPVEIDGNDPPPAPPKVAQPQRDTGRWPALAIGPRGQAGGRIAIAFADLSTQQLLIYQSDALTAHARHALAPGDAGLIHVVDDGKPRATEAWHPQSFPGVQTSISFTPSGKIALAYQDATPVDLMFSLYDPSASPLPKSISRSTVRPTGAAGFWPHMAIVSGTAYLSSATIKAATALIPLNRLFVDAWPAP
jgi:hypothetical protein